MPLVPFFAQTIAPLHDANPSQEATFFYFYFGCSAVVLGVIFVAASLVFMTRRKPSIEAEFATKQELHREVTGLRQVIGEMDVRNTSQNEAIFAKIGAIGTSFDQGMREMHRAIGRLEGEKTLATEIVTLLKQR